MRSIRVTLLVLFAALLAGCPARSIHPLFTEKEAVFNPSLIGSWNNKDEIYTFEKLKESIYRLVIRPRDENDSAVYTVTLGKIGESWFFDSYPIVNSNEHHFMSVHVFTRMVLSGDSLSIATLEDDWLLKMIEEKKIKISHTRRENEIILTASTNELQKFFTAIGTNNDAFPDKKTFARSR
jgi:hypothetical protein